MHKMVRPAHEKWLFENKIAIKKIEQGLKDAAAGRVSSKGSFAKTAPRKNI